MPLCGNSIGTDRRFLAGCTCPRSRTTSTTARSTSPRSRSWPGAGTPRCSTAKAPRKAGSPPGAGRHPGVHRRAPLLPGGRPVPRRPRLSEPVSSLTPHARMSGGDRRSSTASDRASEQEDAQPDEVTEVAPGDPAGPAPDPFTGLGHVNTYLCEDAAAVTARRSRPARPGDLEGAQGPARSGRRDPAGDVHTVVVTHSHPDHFGGAETAALEKATPRSWPPAFRTFFDLLEPDLESSRPRPRQPSDGGAARPRRLRNRFDMRTPWAGATCPGPRCPAPGPSAGPSAASPAATS